MPSQGHWAPLQACKPYAIAVVLLGLSLLLLPSLVFLLVLLSFVAVFFLLPIACASAPLILLWLVLRRSPVAVSPMSTTKAAGDTDAGGLQDSAAETAHDVIETDCSEAPIFDASSTSSSSEEEEHEEDKVQLRTDEHEIFWQLSERGFSCSTIEEQRSFYEVLSFWRRKERGRP